MTLALSSLFHTKHKNTTVRQKNKDVLVLENKMYLKRKTF